MKEIALVLLSLCPALTGMYFSKSLRKRVEALEKVEMMFSLIETNINFLSVPSSEIVEMLTSKEELRTLNFLFCCKDMLGKGENFRNAWMKSLSSRKYTGFLTGNDVALLRLFCENFGSSDKKGEISNCRFCASLLKENIADARRNREKYCDLLSGLGLFTGVALIIMLC